MATDNFNYYFIVYIALEIKRNVLINLTLIQ